MEKLTLDEFKQMYLDLEKACDEVYEKYSGYYYNKGLIEPEEELLCKEFIIKLTSYDLSDIPASFLRFTLSLTSIDIIDFSKTHANIDFDVTLIDYNCKYNFKGCNITNLEKVDYNYIINNRDSFDEETINKYSYLFEELPVLEIGNIKIKYLNTNEGLKKAQELYNYLQDKYFLINDINEIKIVNSTFKVEDSAMIIGIQYDVLQAFTDYERKNNKVYRTILDSIEIYNDEELNYIIGKVLMVFNSYLRESKSYSNFLLPIICYFLYSYKDFELLNDYINNKKLEPIIDKYFKSLLVDYMNGYYDSINDEFLNTNIESFSEYFWINLEINSKKQLEEEKLSEDIPFYVFKILNDDGSLKNEDEIYDIYDEINEDDSLSNEKIIEITKEILNSIDNSGELVKIFNYALDSNKIDLNGDDSYYDPNSDKIIIKNNNKYSTVHTLIHEFFHFYSELYGKRNLKENLYLRELASIFFESYAIKYMIEYYCVSEFKLDFTRIRDSINSLNNKSVDFILKLFKIKKERNIVYEDIITNELISSNPVALELCALLYGENPTDKYFFEKRALGICFHFIEQYYERDEELLDKEQKINISYTLGTELGKKYSDNPECIGIFLNLAKHAKDADYNEAELFRELLENLEKKSKKTTYV